MRGFEHIFGDSKIPLNKWLLAFRRIPSSKKGMSAHQLHRSLGITYKSAWFLAHRIRESMDDSAVSGPLGGANKVVEADETYVGGKAKNRAFRAPAPKRRLSPSSSVKGASRAATLPTSLRRKFASWS